MTEHKSKWWLKPSADTLRKLSKDLVQIAWLISESKAAIKYYKHDWIDKVIIRNLIIKICNKEGCQTCWSDVFAKAKLINRQRLLLLRLVSTLCGRVAFFLHPATLMCLLPSFSNKSTSCLNRIKKILMKTNYQPEEAY